MKFTPITVLFTLASSSFAAPYAKRGIRSSPVKGAIRPNVEQPVPFPHGVPSIPASSSDTDGGLTSVPGDTAPLISDLAGAGAKSLARRGAAVPAAGLPVSSVGGLGGGLGSLTNIAGPVLGEGLQGTPVGAAGGLLRRGTSPPANPNGAGAAPAGGLSGGLPIIGSLLPSLARRSGIPVDGVDVSSIPSEALPLVGNLMKATPAGSTTTLRKREGNPIGPLDPAGPIGPVRVPINEPNPHPTPVPVTNPPASSTASPPVSSPSEPAPPSPSDPAGPIAPLTGGLNGPLGALGSVGNLVRKSTLPAAPVPGAADPASGPASALKSSE